MTAADDALTTAVLALHTALDGWADAVRTAAAEHPGDPEAAVESAGLGEAEQAWDDAFDEFHGAAGRVLGVAASDDDEDDDEPLPDADPEDAVGVELYATVTGSGEGEPLFLLDAASEQVVAALEAAGWTVPEWGVRLVPVERLADDEDSDDVADSDD